MWDVQSSKNHRALVLRIHVQFVHEYVALFSIVDVFNIDSSYFKIIDSISLLFAKSITHFSHISYLQCC